tara:strand:- start:23993 stop:25279 length:1287 start_codon:yes stop_codon:yes gene_type:complete
MSVPIRLIQRNGKIISLDAEKFGISIGRGVAAIPVPVVGERFGADLNIVSIGINLDGVCRDDDCTKIATMPSQALSFIDFTRPNVRDSNTVSSTYFTGDGGTVTMQDIADKPFYIRSTYLQSIGDGSKITFKFILTGTLGAATFPGAGVVLISLNNATLLNNTGPSSGAFQSVAHELATYLSAALANTGNTGTVITSATHTAANSQKLSDAFTPLLVVGQNITLGNGRVNITQQEAGANGDSGTPTFWSTVNDSSGTENQAATKPPSFSSFRGGSANTCRSAGDKIQDLIANTANSNVMGAVGELFQLDTNDDKKSISKNFNTLDPTAGASDDYIVGIQIPYQSIIQAAAANGNNMVARNFLLVTGLGPADRQGSLANVNAATVGFSSTDVYTGIRGTVISFKFAYEAGATSYTYSLEFKPIDMIVGL